MTPLSQRDSRWKDIKIGNSTLSIGGYGCVLTCLAIISNTTPDIVNQKLKEIGGFSGALVVWAKVEQALPSLKFVKRAYTYSNDIVLKAIQDYGACLVEVDGKKIGGDKHWVVYIGDQKIIDPWWGDIRSTSEYPPIGYAVFEIKESQNNSSDEQRALEFLKQSFTELPQDDPLKSGNLEGYIRALKDEHSIIKEVKKNESELKDKVSDLETQNKSLREDLAEEKLITNQQGDVISEQKRDNEDLSTQLGDARKQRDSFQTEAQSWHNKATSLESELTSAKEENNALKGQVSALEKVIKDNQYLKLSEIPRGLLFIELLNRLIKRG